MIGRLLNIVRMPTDRHEHAGAADRSPVRDRVAPGGGLRLRPARCDDLKGHGLHARFLASASPSRPCGRNTSTMTSSVKATRSRSW